MRPGNFEPVSKERATAILDMISDDESGWWDRLEQALTETEPKVNVERLFWQLAEAKDNIIFEQLEQEPEATQADMINDMEKDEHAEHVGADAAPAILRAS